MATERRFRARAGLSRLALGGAAALLALGCASPIRGGVQPPAGALFALHSAPLETNFSDTPVGAKRGEASAHHITNPFYVRIPILTWGDASIAEAAREAGIETVHYVDYELLSVLGVYVQLTVRVSGD